MTSCSEDDILVVTTTVATAADASRLARGLLDARLAACVQLQPGLTSLYRWEGQVCEEPEVRLVIKTLPEASAPLCVWLAAHHPYALPQVTAVRASASQAYARWVRGEIDLSPARPGQTPAR